MSPRSSKNKAARKSSLQSRVTVDKSKKSSDSFIDKIQTDLEKNQSYLNLILGALIVIVLGVLIFNYFNKPAEDKGEVTETAQTMDENGDVAKESLPGSYTVKEGDTLFLIASKYYDDGNKYTEIISENNLPSESIEVGQKLVIPKVEAAETAASSPEGSASASSLAMASISPSPSPSASASPKVSATPSQTPEVKPSGSPVPPAWGKGGATNQTTWGETISGSTYTVVKGDWLSTISGRAYGDIMQYEKIAKANNISDPNVIEVGTVLKIPRE